MTKVIIKLDVTASGTSMVAPATISLQPYYSSLSLRYLKQKQFLNLTKLSEPKWRVLVTMNK
jgi:hypothetical protein